MTDKSFINLNNAATSTKIHGTVATHSLTHAVRHEPCSLERHAKRAVKLVAGDTLLAGTHQVDCLKPDVHFDVAGLKNGANLHSEGLAALVDLYAPMRVDFPPILETRLVSPHFWQVAPSGQIRASTYA